jgi:hypothetical protein
MKQAFTASSIVMKETIHLDCLLKGTFFLAFIDTYGKLDDV